MAPRLRVQEPLLGWIPFNQTCHFLFFIFYFYVQLTIMYN